MAQAFGSLPSGVLKTPEKFTLRVPDRDVDELKQLVGLAKIAPETFYNQQKDGRFGINRDWLIGARDAWLKFDWRKHEDRINSFPNFTAKVDNAEWGTVDIHFAALFSKREDAQPIILLHGWPSSFMEFFPVFDLLMKKYTPETLPYHVIAPSLPGHDLSAKSLPVDLEPMLGVATDCLHQLMLDLGFGGGYTAHGGDTGSYVARFMSMKKGCKAFHLNMLRAQGEEAGNVEELPPHEAEHLQRANEWSTRGSFYFMLHGTRPATCGLAFSTSPVALLAWIGEKYQEWADKRNPIPLETILEVVSLYWFTDTYAGSIFSYIEVVEGLTSGRRKHIPTSKEIPMGYSAWKADLAFMPKEWTEKAYPNLKLYRWHDKGGHFPGHEVPELMLQDLEDFLAIVKG
ncbi:epoxide hydrolase [Colletotrichum zoysiae]|uniref:Epoxide hydrolase n=1 Tax=Colletotrichum zoysiae TaxID=1216348 RepID=A0AAD9HL24_9PEZI|nr:epoxide hydrolase [Colletotrichum zoysiae]